MIFGIFSWFLLQSRSYISSQTSLMGGNALKKVKAARMNKHHYEKIKEDLSSKLEPFIPITFPKEVPGKESFGDVDVLYLPKAPFASSENSEKFNSIHALIQKLFSPIETVTNGDVLSFSYPYSNDEEVSYFQVDMINCHNPVELQILDFYYSYGDMGGLLGRMLNCYGLKLGHKGLYINILNETVDLFAKKKEVKDNNGDGLDLVSRSVIGELVLTTDVKAICEYLHLDYNKWVAGFASSMEIFEFLTSCRFFKPEIFQHLNHDHRVRATKRPFYVSFLNYIGITELVEGEEERKQKDVMEKEAGVRKDKLYGMRYNYQLQAIRDFGKEQEIEEILHMRDVLAARKAKFNGHLLSQRYGCTGEALGKLIGFKAEIKKMKGIAWESWLDATSADDVMHELQLFVEKHQREVQLLQREEKS